MFQEGILVLDFGGREARAVTRRVRSEQVFCSILPYDVSLAEIRSYQPRGIILAGGAQDAFEPDAKDLAEAVYALGLPTLGIGYGARILLRHSGAALSRSIVGSTTAQVTFEDSPLFSGITESERVFDQLDEIQLPDGFRQTAATEDGIGVAFSNEQQKLYGMQFYPEANDPDGLLILRNFARDICGAEPNWNSERLLDWSLEHIHEKVGNGQALIAISGGVDSAVCAALMQRAIGDKLHCMHVDTALMRKGEREQVQRFFEGRGIQLKVIDARQRFLNALKGIQDNVQKRVAVFHEFEQIVDETLRSMDGVEFLAQSTIYTDILDEPLFWDNPRDNLIEPLRMLFKDEVRDLGALLGLPPELVNRQAFPGAGLAVRCMGEVTSEKLNMVRDADQILHQEIAKAGLDKRIRQYFALLTSDQTRGTEGIGHTIAIRAVNPAATGQTLVYRLPHDLLERIVERITAEVAGVNRVVYDVTGQPPALTEWE